MIEKIEVNERIQEKIRDSELDVEMKTFLLEILRIEFREGKHDSRYSKLYTQLIDKTHILLERGKE